MRTDQVLDANFQWQNLESRSKQTNLTGLYNVSITTWSPYQVKTSFLRATEMTWGTEDMA